MDKRLWENENQDKPSGRTEAAIAKNFDTTIIGAISDIEQYFGHLWGHGKKKSELSQEQREWLEDWLVLRNSILDRGNERKRESLKLLSGRGSRYQYYFHHRGE